MKKRIASLSVLALLLSFSLSAPASSNTTPPTCPPHNPGCMLPW
ncbi:hypothetical protein CAY60_007140 [Shouchella clausii]|uniref:Uncharacterized protein n=1 Tax=Shouchella rhizosphaerae TaxID=866786 RepID=A0ABZ2CU92_9BACI|nr:MULTISPECIES: hypothetical protein [Shouchella]MDO7267160.1 hypothetical protein [Shouchella clausii]MDO7282451.1 hypothetical protein [Shouchella clausii]MDO7287886.1 hypothetical protein [Shouchella clausii]MDO7302546.1 hypothetical protein [Shouchella clausii]MDP0465959.1 hypothetical protein [Shouchella rhizosphaerae]